VLYIIDTQSLTRLIYSLNSRTEIDRYQLVCYIFNSLVKTVGGIFETHLTEFLINSAHAQQDRRTLN